MMLTGVRMSKVYKVKNNKLVVYLPFDVIDALKIKDGDDIDFLKYGESTYLVAKKMDIVKLLSKSNAANAEEPKAAAKTYVPNANSNKNISVEPTELAVLKNLDTLRYNDTTSAKVASMLNGQEKETLQVLLEKGFITSFKKAGDKDTRYSIQKSVYDMFFTETESRRKLCRKQFHHSQRQKFSKLKLQAYRNQKLGSKK